MAAKSKIAFQKKSAQIRGLKTAWLASGKKNKDILLFLHGFPDDAWIWKEQIEFFAKDYFVIAPMLRGADGSQPARDLNRYGMKSVALDLIAILREEDPQTKKNITVIGHDLGTLYGSYLATLLGKRLNGLVLINGGHPLQVLSRVKNLRQILKSWYVYLFLTPFLPQLLMATVGPFLLKRTQLKNGVPKEKIKDTSQALRYTPATILQYKGIVSELLDVYQKRNAFHIEAPVLLISTTNDRFVEPASLEEAKIFAENPTVRIVPGKHWIQCEKPEKINQLIAKFVQGEA